MISNGNELFKLIDSVLKLQGYKKKDIWYKDYSECLCYYTIGKNFHGGQYGSDFGCFLKELYPESFFLTNPPEYALASLRIGFSFFVQNKDEIKKPFDLENMVYSGNEREVRIIELLKSYVLPCLDQISTKEGIKDFYNKHPNARNYMDIKLKKALALF